GSDGVASLAFGGGGPASGRSTWRWETTDQVQVYTRASKHKIKVYGQSRLEGYSRDATRGTGLFSSNSLADLAAGRPATFSRTLFSPGDSGGEWSGALAVADLWKRGRFFQVMYGARLEANRFTARPARNPAVEHAFGARTDHAPNAAHVSPRLGLTWTYAGQRAGGNNFTGGPLGSFQVGPRGVLRAGIGEFRNTLRPDLLSRARIATGLPGGEQRLFCGGDAVPVPDWAAYVDDPSSIPTACANGAAPAFSDAAPGVELFAGDYTAARSWRGNVGWSGGWRRVTLGMEATYSLGLNQPGGVDLNFGGTPAFTLPQEGGRPIYAPAADVVAATGVVSSVAARRDAAFGRVWEQRSDLRVRARQLSVTASPRLGYRYHLSASYTLADTREQQRGFDGSTFGDPRALAWAPGSFTPRHQVLAQAGAVRGGVSFTFSARAYSGLPYTPMVAGDVNGDGLSNDRAFVFDPAGAPDPDLASAMQALIGGAPDGAAECLRRQLGQAAARNSCRAPWSVATNARLGFTPKLTHLPRRVNVSMNLANPLGGIDRLVHGAGGLHGWGSTAIPDPTLLYVRGFDPAARAFRYDVNPRFGATAPSLRTLREPFRLTLDVNVDLGVSFEVQQLRRALRPGRSGDRGTRLTAEALRERYSREVTNVYTVILDMSDSLLLTPQQTQALKQADGAYRARADSVWLGLGTYLAALPDHYDAAEAVKRQEAATDSVWALAHAERSTVEGILSPLQITMLPQMVIRFFAEKAGSFRF
ncbi:MAG TPA: hypothetical protein VFH27_07205, partial [Longimicrobiaceae bacterium]|nr:hypothetical protein [Longimicrobiaceae bacterium]